MEILPQPTQEFLEQIQEKYSGMVYRIALFQTKRIKAAHTVYRHVFRRLVEQEEPFENDDHLKAWMIGETIRQGTKQQFLFFQSAISGVSGQDGLLHSLAALPWKLRVVYLLHEAEGYNVFEIAGLLHRKETEVRKQLSRARIRLNQRLENALYEYRMEERIKSVVAPEELCRKTVEELLHPDEAKRSELKYAVSTALVALVVLGCIFVPFLESRGENGSTAPVTASKVQSSEKAPAPLTGKDIEITLANDDTYPSNGSAGSGDGDTMEWTEDIDFNLRCTGENIKRVTYTAHNCEFLNKSFFTSEQVEANQVNRNVFGSLTGSGVGSSLIYWGFSSIGYVYSVDYEEQLNSSYFGLRLNYVEDNVKEFENDREKEEEKLFRLSKEAYRKANVTAEIERTDGRVVIKQIQLTRSAASGPVTILVGDVIVD